MVTYIFSFFFILVEKSVAKMASLVLRKGKLRRRRAKSFFAVFSFELGNITKHLMTGPAGNSEFCFPATSMFPSASPRETLRVSGKQNSLFPLIGASH